MKQTFLSAVKSHLKANDKYIKGLHSYKFYSGRFSEK